MRFLELPRPSYVKTVLALGGHDPDYVDAYYNLGQDLVRQYIERAVGANGTEAARWQAFTALLSSPRLPSTLR